METPWVIGIIVTAISALLGFVVKLVLNELQRLGIKVAELNATLNGNGARGLTGEVEKVREEFHEGNGKTGVIIGKFEVRLERVEADLKEMQSWRRGPQYGQPLGGGG